MADDRRVDCVLRRQFGIGRRSAEGCVSLGPPRPPRRQCQLVGEALASDSSGRSDPADLLSAASFW
jgi:hypothetical protein